MSDTAAVSFEPSEKSEAYWKRELTANGRKINDALDKHEAMTAWRNQKSQDEHSSAWDRAEWDKYEWRKELKDTGRLITPMERDQALEEAIAEDALRYAPQTSTEVLGRDDEGRLHRDPKEGPAQIDYTDSLGGIEQNRTELYVVHGEVIARAEFHTVSDEEASSYRETWYDANGEKHSFNGNPAEVIQDRHYIPEETYLDESVAHFYDHGRYKDSVDTTYEDIVSSKPLTVQQAFGYAIDGPEPVSIVPVVEHGGRFDKGYDVNAATGLGKSETTDHVASVIEHASPETREDRFSEITRRYAEATRSPQAEMPPTITRVDQLESYRQERMFYDKHNGASAMSDTSDPYKPSLVSRAVEVVDRAYNRFTFEMSFPSRESREAFNRPLGGASEPVVTARPRVDSPVAVESVAKATAAATQTATAAADYWRSIGPVAQPRHIQPDLFQKQSKGMAL